MDIAIVTGAGSGVGLAVARKLVELGFRVYGLGGNYKDIPFEHVDFVPAPCDLGSREDLRLKVEALIEKEGPITCVINNAKVYPKGALEATSLEDIETTVRINLLCPLWLAKLTQEGLRRLRGHFINIAPTSPDGVRGGAIGAATGGGLKWMNEALFSELREYGVKICTIYPQINRERPSEGNEPASGRKPHAKIDPESVAEAVAHVVNHREGNVITELVLRPERYWEPSEPAVLELPHPPAKPLPLPEAKPIYKIPSKAKLKESEAMKKAKAAKDLRGPVARYEDIDADTPHDLPEEDHDDFPEEVADDKPKRKRRSRRGKRRDRDDALREGEAHKEESSPTPVEGEPEQSDVPSEESKKKKRNRRNRGRGENKRASFRPGEDSKQPFKPSVTAKPLHAEKPDKASLPKKPPKSEPETFAKTPVKKIAKKKTAKKKTTTKKTTAKKAATKKTVKKKVAAKKTAAKKATRKKTVKKKAE